MLKFKYVVLFCLSYDNLHASSFDFLNITGSNTITCVIIIVSAIGLHAFC